MADPKKYQFNCPNCGKLISRYVSPCMFCGYEFEPDELPDGEVGYPPDHWAYKHGGETPGNDKRDCFIATVAYGSAIAPQVTFLRRVRDRDLRQSSIGNHFVDGFEWIYYKISPYIVKVMHRYSLFKHIIRWLVVVPIVYFLMGIFKPVDLIRKKIQDILK